MKPEDLQAVATLERDATSIRGQYPRIAAGITWLCKVAREQHLELNPFIPGVDDPGTEPPPKEPDPRDAVMAKQAARITELEKRMRLTPDVVLALERAELKERAPDVERERPARAVSGAHTPSGRALREAARAKAAEPQRAAKPRKAGKAKRKAPSRG